MKVCIYIYIYVYMYIIISTIKYQPRTNKHQPCNHGMTNTYHHHHQQCAHELLGRQIFQLLEGVPIDLAEKAKMERCRQW